MSDTPTYDALAHMLLDVHAHNVSQRPDMRTIARGRVPVPADPSAYGKHRKDFT